MKNRKKLSSGKLLVGLVAVGILILTSVAVRASHLFSDVPDSPASTHDSVSWMFTRAITTGCAPGLYCPTSTVTRAQMALFMNRLGVALTPTFLKVDAAGAFDLDTAATICATTAYTPTFPQRARIDGMASMTGPGPFTAAIRSVYSTDGGTTWLQPTPGSSFGRPSISATGEWGNASQNDILNLVAGTPYLFGVRVDRSTADGGTADVTNSRCITTVQITNRNPDGIAPEAGAGASVRPSRERSR